MSTEIVIVIAVLVLVIILLSVCFVIVVRRLSNKIVALKSANKIYEDGIIEFTERLSKYAGH